MWPMFNVTSVSLQGFTGPAARTRGIFRRVRNLLPVKFEKHEDDTNLTSLLSDFYEYH